MVDFLLSVELCTPVISRRPCLEGRTFTKVVTLLVLQFAMLTDLVLDDHLFDFNWQRNIVAPFVLQKFDSKLSLFILKDYCVACVF